MNNKITLYLHLIRFHKPIGTLLLLWPTLWALWIASHGHLPFKITLIFLVGVFLTRSAGCVINDIADRNFDGHVQRTRERPLASKQLSVKEAVILFFALSLMAFSLVLMLNIFTILLSFVALGLTIIYPFTKRVTHLPQFILGAAFAWGILMAFTAIQNAIPPQAWCLFLAAWCWIVAFDTQYALVDVEDDRKIGIKSTAILFNQEAKNIITLLHIIMLSLLILIGKFYALHPFYYFSLFIAACMLYYQYQLLSTNVATHYFRAFLNNNWVGLIIFLGLIYPK